MTDARPGFPTTRVAHVGLLGEQPGGMAQLVNGYLRWTDRGSRPLGICSTRRKHDPLQVPLALVAAVRVARFARGRQGVAVFHLAEGGSFLREGGLLLLARALGGRTVAQIHGADFDTFALRRPWLVRAILSRAHAVAMLTDASAVIARRLLQHDADVRVVPNVIGDPARAAGRATDVLFGGAIGPRKGADVLLAAWPAVHVAHPRWRLVLAGPVEPGWVLPPLPPGAEHLGPLTHEALLDRLAEVRVAVLPSRREALPVFLIEALASRCAVVGTDTGQVVELLGGGAGITVPPGDIPALTDVLNALLGDDAAIAHLAAAGRDRFEQRYSAAAARPVLESFWREVADG